VIFDGRRYENSEWKSYATPKKTPVSSLMALTPLKSSPNTLQPVAPAPLNPLLPDVPSAGCERGEGWIDKDERIVNMTAKEIAQLLIDGSAQLAAVETVAAGLSDSDVVVEYYYAVDSNTPEDDVQSMIRTFEGYVNQETLLQ